MDAKPTGIRLKVGECYADEKGRYWYVTGDYGNGKFQAESFYVGSDFLEHPAEFEVFLWNGNVAHPELSDLKDGPASIVSHTENIREFLDRVVAAALPALIATHGDDDRSEITDAAYVYAMNIYMQR
ncbi:MAG: hypothetical protein RSE32_14520 [Comamonas sp.]|uniref:hypothetical protein n=1 Tax=Comamonas sp. TaxID=34028 RepID=UPI002FC61973